MRDKIFYTACFAFLFGVLVRSFIPTSQGVGTPTFSSVGVFYFALLGVVVALALFVIFKFLSKSDFGILGSVFILLFSFGILRFHIADSPTPEIFESQVVKRASLVGEVVDEPVWTEYSERLVIEVKNGEEKTKILVITNFGSDFRYGDKVEFSGVLKKPENFTTDQGKEFDYINYLRKDGIRYVMSYATVDTLSRGHGNKVKSALFFVKGKFLEKMNAVIPAPEHLLMAGLTLGERAAFSDELRDNFITTGTIHIVALSGQNITLVAETFKNIFAFLPQTAAVSAGILSILLFVVMTGASSTAIRAGIMATLVLAARKVGQPYHIGRALLLAGIAMIMINPYVLVFDVSFQLSFLATIAVVYLTSKVQRYLLWIPGRTFREICAMTFAAYIFVLPFILYNMGTVSLVALPTNILILPLIPFTMLVGFLTSLVGIFSHILSIPLGLLSYLLLHYELFVIDFFARVPYASLAIPNFPLAVTVCIYLYFTYLLFYKKYEENYAEK